MRESVFALDFVRFLAINTLPMLHRIAFDNPRSVCPATTGVDLLAFGRGFNAGRLKLHDAHGAPQA